MYGTDIFAGADIDALALMGGVSGVDYAGPYVGAGNPFALDAQASQALAARNAASIHNPALQQRNAQMASSLAPQAAAAIMAKGLAALRFQQQMDREQRLRQAALAGQIPQIPIPCSTAAVVVGGAAFTLSPVAGVPVRITGWSIASSIAPFFGISSVTAARLSLFGGGTGLLPAESFAGDTRHPPLENPILAAGVPIIVVGQNTDTGTDHFFMSNFYAIDRTPSAERLGA